MRPGRLRTLVVGLVALSLLAVPLGGVAAADSHDTANLSVSAPTTAQPGDTVEVTYTVEHTGDDMGGYFIKDALPDGWTFEGIASSSLNGSDYSADSDTLMLLERFESGESGSVTVEVTVPEDASGPVQLSPSATDSYDTNVTSTATVMVESDSDAQANTDFSVSAPESAQAGDTVEVTYTVENTGDATEGYVVYDGLADGWSVQSVSDNADYAAESGAIILPQEVAAGESVTVTATVSVPADASGDATISATARETDGAETTASTTVSVEASEGTEATTDFSVSAPSSAQPGDTVEVTYTVENTGTTNTSYTVYENLPEGWSVQSSSDNVAYSPLSDAFVLLSYVEPGETATVTATVQIPDDESGDFTLAPTVREGETGIELSATTGITVQSDSDDNQPPTVDAGGPYTVAPGESVSLDASWGDADGSIAAKSMEVVSGPGSVSDGTYTAPDNATDGQTATVMLSATDDDGATTTATATVTISAGEDEPMTVLQAIDENDDRIIQTSELLRAANLWQSQEAVSGTEGETVSTSQLLRMANLWQDQSQF